MTPDIAERSLGGGGGQTCPWLETTGPEQDLEMIIYMALGGICSQLWP